MLTQAGIAPAIRIYDESIVSGRSLNLYCEISHQSIALVLADKKQNKIYAFENFSDSRFSGLDSKILSFNYRTASVQIINKDYTVVPSAVFEADEEEEWFFFNNRQALQLLSDRVNAYHLVNIFGYHPESLPQLTVAFRTHHHITSLLESVRLRKQKLHLNFNTGLLDVVVSEGKNLLLCNTFQYKSDEDALYYALLVCEQLNVEDPKVAISGRIEKQSGVSTLLSNHFSNVIFAEPPVDFAYGFEKLNKHLYNTAFSHLLCES